MRIFINAWLRRWADASLRKELHQAQEKAISSRRTTENVQANLYTQIRAWKAREAKLKQKYSAASKFDSNLIKALKERVPEEIFLGAVEYSRNKNRKVEP